MASITLIGPGAIGLSVGSALLDAGHDVTFVSRQPFETLSLNMNGAEVRERPVRVVTAEEAPRADWVILCVKAHQVASTATALKAAVGPGTYVAVLQNGVEHVDNVAPYVPEETVILPAVIDMPSSKLGLGQAAWRRKAHMFIEDTLPGRAFRDLFEGSYLTVETTDDILTRMWRKLCLNAGSGAILCLTGQPMKVFHAPGIAELARGILHECLAVGRAEGAKLDDAVVEEQIALWLAAGSDETNSMFDDFRAGRPTEWNARNGVLVRKGEKHGIATPVSSVVVPLLAAHDDGVYAG